MIVVLEDFDHSTVIKPWCKGSEEVWKQCGLKELRVNIDVTN